MTMPLSAIALLLAGASEPYPPQRAHGRYTSQSYALAFPTVHGTWTCPIPPNWTGSDHGTILFLTPPARCYGIGFPSIARGFEPGTTPRIEIYYDRTFIDDGIRPLTAKACRRVATVRLFGSDRPVCAMKAKAGLKTVRIASLYRQKEYEVELTLVTTPARYRRDFATLQLLASVIGTCDQNREKGPGACTGIY
jgi:hypothetical protein